LGTAIYNVTLHPLAKYPGPKLWAASFIPDSLSSFNGRHVNDISALHRRYGPVVRTGPSSLSYTDGRAWKGTTLPLTQKTRADPSTDAYGFRPGKGQVKKDPKFYLRDPSESFPSNIIREYESRNIGKLLRLLVVANDADHARYRRTLAHAFSDQALRSQESILNIYFNLLIQKLNGYIDGPQNGKLDMMSIYNQTTFDIIGDLAFGEPFYALEAGKYHPWIANVFKSMKLTRWFRVGGRYPLILRLFKTAAQLMPVVRQSRQTLTDYTTEKVKKRLKTDTDRKDFTSYVRFPQRIAAQYALTKADLET
jgi:Cytochrome P450